MLYTLVNSVVIPGKMAEWGESFNKESMPLFPRVGLKLVGQFHAYTGNMNEAYTLFVWDDLTAYQKSREVRQKNKDYQTVYAKSLGLMVSQTLSILEPNPWSPMK